MLDSTAGALIASIPGVGKGPFAQRVGRGSGNPFTGIVGADEVLLLKNEFPSSNPPEHPGFPITAGPAPEGYRGFMAVEDWQINPVTGQVDKAGAFLSNDPIPSVRQIRNNLAVRDDWKANPTFVQEFEVAPGTQIQQSTVGPQINVDGTYLPGGGSQTQVLLPSGTYPISVLTPIGPAVPIK